MSETNRGRRYAAGLWLVVLLWQGSAAAQPPALPVAPPDSPINVAITTHLGDAQKFRKGDEISLLLSLDRDAYVLLIYRDAAGRLTRLLPLPGTTDQHMATGAFLPFPDRQAGLRLTVTPPFGQEAVWVFAASTPFPLAEIDVLLAPAGSFGGLLQRIRHHGNGITYGEAHTVIDTEATAKGD